MKSAYSSTWHKRDGLKKKVTHNDDEDDENDVSKVPIWLIFLFYLSNLNF